MPRITKVLADNIKHFRELKNLTQQEFGKLSKLSRASINRLENGSQWIGLDKIAQICEVLDIEESVLFFDRSASYSDLAFIINHWTGFNEFQRRTVFDLTRTQAGVFPDLQIGDELKKKTKS